MFSSFFFVFHFPHFVHCFILLFSIFSISFWTFSLHYTHTHTHTRPPQFVTPSLYLPTAAIQCNGCSLSLIFYLWLVTSLSLSHSFILSQGERGASSFLVLLDEDKMASLHFNAFSSFFFQKISFLLLNPDNLLLF